MHPALRLESGNAISFGGFILKEVDRLDAQAQLGIKIGVRKSSHDLETCYFMVREGKENDSKCERKS